MILTRVALLPLHTSNISAIISRLLLFFTLLPSNHKEAIKTAPKTILVIITMYIARRAHSGDCS